MVQVRISTNGGRKNILANTNETVMNIIERNGIDTTGASLMLKGMTLSATDANATLEQLGVKDGESVILNVTVKASAAFEAKIENNIFTVTTDIPEDVVKSGYAALVAKDENGNDVYAAGYDSTGVVSISTFEIKGNTFINGKLAATTILPDGTTEDDLKGMYGDALLAAKKYTKIIAEEAAEKTAAVNAIFEG